MNVAVEKLIAVVLISGGLDSATILAMAKAQGYSIYALAFDYGQRHRSELDAARKIAERSGAEKFKIVTLDLSSIGGSALTDTTLDIPTSPTEGIPITYVPARNTVFLSIAMGWAEVLRAQAIFIGVNAVDYSGYPDCRPAYITAFQQMANLATRAGVEGQTITVHAPLIHLSKAEIIMQGTKLGVDYSQTVSCYQANQAGQACGKCDSCRLRREGFQQSSLPDPTHYY
jgi:7-cyano-7-deazaguanine synthase